MSSETVDTILQRLRAARRRMVVMAAKPPITLLRARLQVAPPPTPAPAPTPVPAPSGTPVPAAIRLAPFPTDRRLRLMKRRQILRSLRRK